MLTSYQNNPVTSLPQQGTSSSYVSIEISDAFTKFSLYIQKLSALEELPLERPRCEKLVRLAFETFVKYSQSEQFCRQSFQLCKLQSSSRRSYYSLYLIDLMIKNSKYVIKMGKKQVEGLFKAVWQKVYTQKENEEKLQNMRIMLRCWGYIYSEKMEESVRRWLEGRYAIKRVELSEENQKAIREIFSDRRQQSGRASNVGQNRGINQALLSSLVGDDANNSSVNKPSIGEGRQQLQKQGIKKAPVKSGQRIPQVGMKKTGSKLQGVNKSLLQALDLD